MERYFSVEQANALIPRLRSFLARVQRERQRLVELRPVVEKAKEAFIADWGTPRGAEYVEVLEAFQQAVGAIEDLGVLVKDFDLGLCDFPHEREGRLVYLCWKLDEDEVSWWHDTDAGFAGRQPL